MNSNESRNESGNTSNSCCKSSFVIYAAGILGALMIMAFLVGQMKKYTTPAPLGAARAEERKKNLVELRGAEQTALTTYDWQDKGKSLVRLPIDRAMDLAIAKWKNPATARANLISQIDKASAPAPKAPEKPSAFE